jgi:hypothetical protein
MKGFVAHPERLRGIQDQADSERGTGGTVKLEAGPRILSRLRRPEDLMS